MILSLAFAPFLVLAMQASEVDPQRPACRTPACKKIQSFSKQHYCSESPYGDGPGDTCDLKFPKPESGIAVLAHVECEWVESKNVCRQYGEPPPELRAVLTRELRKLGLPAAEDKRTNFTVWKSKELGWSVAEATYAVAGDSTLTLCQIVVMLDPQSKVFILHQVRLQKTDFDVPQVTSWDIQDLSTLDDKPVAILRADAYENHWLEAHMIEDGKPKLIFSGLGYRL